MELIDTCTASENAGALVPVQAAGAPDPGGAGRPSLPEDFEKVEGDRARTVVDWHCAARWPDGNAALTIGGGPIRGVMLGDFALVAQGGQSFLLQKEAPPERRRESHPDRGVPPGRGQDLPPDRGEVHMAGYDDDIDGESVDARVLSVIRDPSGRRYRSFRAAVIELTVTNWDNWPISGPRTVLWCCQFLLDVDGSPRARHSRWMHECKLTPADPSVADHEAGLRALEFALTYD